MRSVITPATSAVTVRTWANGSPIFWRPGIPMNPRMVGFTNRM
jgi:hypothetical protein